MMRSIGVALLCGSAVSVVVGAPEKIVVKPDGEYVIVDDGSGRESDLRDVTWLPVYSEGPGGQLLPGVYYSGTSNTGNHVWPMPVRLVVDSDGTYSIETAYWSMSHGPKGTLRHHLVPGSEFVQIRHDLDIDDRAELDGHGYGSGAVWSREIARESRKRDREQRRRERAEYEAGEGEYRTPSILRNAILLMLGRQ